MKKINSNQIIPHSTEIFRLNKSTRNLALAATSGEYFPVFTLYPYRPCSVQLAISVLISQPIYNTFKFGLKWWQSEKSEFAINLSINGYHKKINLSLGTLICPLQITNWYWTLSLTLHAANGHFTHEPLDIQNYSISHNLDSDQNFQNQIKYIWDMFFIPLHQFIAQNSNYKYS